MNVPGPSSAVLNADAMRAAAAQLQQELLAARVPEGHWEGRLASSPLSTATAISALAIVGAAQGRTAEFASLIRRGLDWIVPRQTADGGWGDTEHSLPNIATTMLVQSAIHLAGAAQELSEPLARAEAYVQRLHGRAGLAARYGSDKTFQVPILTNAALAGLVDWREIAPLPFELACFPQSWYRLLRLPVVSYAIPALVAIGQARFRRAPPRNPLLRWTRSLAVEPSLRVLRRMQPNSGGFLEATPLTAFVVMSLAGTGKADDAAVQRGVQFLVASVRADGAWPIDTNLASWVTCLAVHALAACPADLQELDCFTFLLSCQHRVRHPFTGADAGGWGWTNLSGAVPDADDTPAALLALAAWQQQTVQSASTAAAQPSAEQVALSVAEGLRWLLNLQNRDGGWPTFCRGWGLLPFDRSSADLTAHALRALRAWQDRSAWLAAHVPRGPAEQFVARWIPRAKRAVEKGFRFLARAQRPDGSWIPLWFGNQHHPAEENPIYGTARVLLAYRDAARLADEAAVRGLHWLATHQNADGSWGGDGLNPAAPRDYVQGTTEETAVAVEALAAACSSAEAVSATARGVAWLLARIAAGRHRESSPIGFYFARLWYDEELYPLVFALSALAAVQRGPPLGQSSPEQSK